MTAMRTPSPLLFGSQWASWVLITVILLLLVALIVYW
jgi:uncharacterized membrane protein